MQEVATERRPAAQFAGVDLRRPKGYSPPPPVPAAATAAPASQAVEGEPCPRCESRDTKFCYFNNYNTAQPRHFCKGCRRYWTKGGTLRNVPVGGGTRKKASSSSSSSSSSSAYAAAAKPKRPYKKKRRVAPPPEPAAAGPAPAVTPAESAAKVAPFTTATTTTDSAKVTTTTVTDAASEVTTELVVPAAAAATTEDDSLTRLLQADDDDAVALGLGLSDLPSCKLLEPVDSFEWPASFDLGATCWGPPAVGSGFGCDPVDPALFLNLP